VQSPVRHEDLWIRSVAHYHAREREQRKWEWVRYFDRMAELHRNLSADYTARAETLLNLSSDPSPSGEGCTHTHVRDKDGSGPYLHSPGEERERSVARL
jgi:hypothetical protein